MDLKLSEGIIRTTQYKFMLKNPKNLDTLIFTEKSKIS